MPRPCQKMVKAPFRTRNRHQGGCRSGCMPPPVRAELVEGLFFLLPKRAERPLSFARPAGRRAQGERKLWSRSAMSTHAARLAALRDQLKRDRLDGFVVPLTDEH